MFIRLHDHIHKGVAARVLDFKQQSAFETCFYTKYGKRALDVLVATVGLILLLPVLAIAACCIKLTSDGPVFYRQVRIGRGARPFEMLKLRSMRIEKSTRDLMITVAGDPRVTPVGRLLRRYKIDELPQLWNVICGDMSLVGPRPEVPAYIQEYTTKQLVVLSARPGITDPASLAYRYEEELLARQVDPEKYYKYNIISDKLERNISYLEKVSFQNDLRIILQTIISALSAHKAEGRSDLRC